MLSKSEHIGIDVIWNKAIYLSVLVSRTFLIVHFTNLMHASVCPISEDYMMMMSRYL